MNMLTPYQHELIQREIDGENTPAESVEVRKLVESEPEALALLTSLRSLDAMLREVPERAPSPRVTQQILGTIPVRSRASLEVGYVQGITQSITSWANQQWNGVTNFMGEMMLTKKVLIIGTTAVAAIAIIGQAVVGYTPSVFDAGTVGAGDGMSGVQQAERFKGRTISEKDVTLSNPQIHALFQNDQVLKLVKSEVFHEAMRNESFRELQSSEAFHKLMSSEAYRLLLSNEAYVKLMSTEAYKQLMSSEAYRQLMSNEAFREVMANDAYRAVMSNEAYRVLMSNEAYRLVMTNDAYRVLMANEAYRVVMTNDAYRMVMASEAYRHLESSDMFRAVSRSQSLSEAFLNQATRAQQD